MADFQPSNQTVINWAGGLISTLFGVIVVIGSWVFTKLYGKVDVLAENQKHFASVESVVHLEARVLPLVSRTELLAYMAQMRDDAEKRNDQMREDRQRMHQENLDSIKSVRTDISELREAVREDVSGVHSRVDDLFRK